MGLLGLSGCGSPSSASMDTSAEATSEITQAAETTQEERTELVKTGSMELQYAENFTVDYYEDGYKMLTTLPDSQRYLLVPEGQPVPQGLDEDVSILQEPLQNIYLVASGVMDMFASLDAVDHIPCRHGILCFLDVPVLLLLPGKTDLNYWCLKAVIWRLRTG